MTDNAISPSVPLSVQAAPSASNKWGVANFSAAPATVVPAGKYSATIADARCLETKDTEALLLIVNFDCVTSDGETFNPEPLFLTVAAVEGSTHVSRVRSGLRDLSRMARALGVDLEGLPLEDIAAALLGLPCVVAVARSGSGVEATNTVRQVFPAAVA